MQSDNRPDGQKRLSFIEEARRAQIVVSAQEVLAQLGYANTSLARIAESAGISKGVISYHFAGKNELMEQVVEKIYREITTFVLARTEQEATAAGALRTTILSVAEFMQDHRAQLLALGEVQSNLRTPDGARRYGMAFNEPIYHGREELLRRGQADGEFRPFDTRVMAVTVQAGLDAMFAYWVSYPDHDLHAHAVELADMFDLATRRERPGEA
ncbi:TetR family transcriptional regulator [Phycicoccus sp. CSK15P-2]|uniref:TetR/AcrR family transcriptional regulator n=1 Tax=Phycicoccus sp. CSK15P-2 TaxID=2807627 RepID=UPI0019525BAF|nr:TetR/AcrR family transcriptional regulator [Phycicoccus sp. CSK15P-2]MBM6404456.1 TetR family transcriptional regulator [Phycicoccus sp. CSK15P-2]